MEIPEKKCHYPNPQDLNQMTESECFAKTQNPERGSLLQTKLTPHPEEIAETVKTIALNVSRGGKDWLRDEFVQEALGKLYEPRPRVIRSIIEIYDPSKPLEPWLSKVLKQMWNTKLSVTNKRARKHSELCPENEPAARSVKECPEMLSELDCTRILSWKKPKYRVVLLLISELYLKISEHFWITCRDHALKTYPKLAGVSLADLREFLQEFDYDNGGFALVANLLDIRPNTLSKMWERQKQLLTELDYFRNLLNN